jgi:hypothetical protein
MSRTEETTLTCPACAHEQAFTMWTSVNVTLDPELKQRLLDRSLIALSCEHSGQTADVQYNLLYHDMQANLMVWYVTDDQKPEALSRLAASMGVEGLTLRQVDSLNELIEKVRIADDGLDDRLIEMLKLILWEKLPEERKPGGLQLLYEQMVEDAGNAPQIGFAALTDEGTRMLLAPKPIYDRLNEYLSLILTRVDEQGGQWLRVDAQYASWLMQQATSQGDDPGE